jgi:hypothetical protein
MMTVCCGTYRAEEFEIDLDSYVKPKPTDASLDELDKAYDLLKKTMGNSTFANDGNRNNSAVNGCIALHVMGYDAVAWFNAFCEDQKINHLKRWYLVDLDLFMEHVERVGKYLSKWGPEGNEGAALNYTV